MVITDVHVMMDEVLASMKATAMDDAVVAGSADRQYEPPWSAAMMDRVAPGDLRGGVVLFYQLTKGMVTTAEVQQQIKEATSKTAGPVWFVIWIRHHWILAELHDGIYLHIYDSARSQLVSQDVARLAMLLRLPVPVFRIVPQQHAASEECGVFVYVYMMMRRKGREIPCTDVKVSMRAVVDACADGVCAMGKVAEKMMRSLTSDTVRAGEPRTGDVLWIRWRREGESTYHEERAVCLDNIGGRRSMITFRMMNGSMLKRLSGTDRWSYPVRFRRDFLITDVRCASLEEPVMLAVQPNDETAPGVVEGLPCSPDRYISEQQYSNYPQVLEEVELRSLPYGLPGEVLPVSQFKAWRIRGVDEAKHVTPALVWSAVTEDVRRAHIRELSAFHAWVVSHPFVTCGF